MHFICNFVYQPVRIFHGHPMKVNLNKRSIHSVSHVQALQHIPYKSRSCVHKSERFSPSTTRHSLLILKLSQESISVRTYVIHFLGTYVTILCNWLNPLTKHTLLVIGQIQLFLILQETVFQDQVLKSSSLSKKQVEKCKFIKARQLACVEV